MLHFALSPAPSIESSPLLHFICVKHSFLNHFALRIFAKPAKGFLGFTIWYIVWSKKQTNKQKHCGNVQHDYDSR
jgi:hypothetical protein